MSQLRAGLGSASTEASNRQEGPLLLTNPAYPGYFADPFVFEHEGVYYAVGTGPGQDLPAMEFPLLRSENFVDWHPVGHALVRPEARGHHYWAPEITYHDGVFYMYYSVGDVDGHVLRVATSLRPDGPYVDTGVPLLDPTSTPFAIDAHPFKDALGNWFLFYARDFLDSAEGARSGTALVVAPLHDMTHITVDFTVVMRAHHDWQRFESNRLMYGGRYDWHTLEGPCVIEHDGRYYCLYSGGNWQGDSYGLDFVVADSPMGPYEDTNRGQGARVLSTFPGRVLGPGHNSVVLGPDGVTPYVAYHAWDPSLAGRRLCFDKLIWTSDGPRCLGPTWEPQVIS